MNKDTDDFGLPSQLQITDRALAKAITYARATVEEYGPCECLGYLIGDRGSPEPTVNDVLLAPQQVATETSVELSGTGVLQAGREIQARGATARGWFHSHGRMAVYESCIDETTTEQLLTELAAANTVYQEEEVRLGVVRRDGEIYLSNDGHPCAVVDGDQAAVIGMEPDAEELIVRRVVPVGFTFSLVVNVYAESHCQLAVTRSCGFCRSDSVTARSVPVLVMETGQQCAPDRAEARREVREKITCPRKRYWNCYGRSGYWASDGYGYRRDYD